MAYIGNIPAEKYSSFVKQDFTTSATTTYTLDQPVTNENEIALFINFVRQEPTTAYTASGVNLTLSSATSATDDMYCIFLGKALQTVNPPANSVGASQLADSSVTSAKLASGAVPNQSAFKNIIINGDMSIAQRSTSETSQSSSGYICLDRYRHTISIGTWTISQSTDVPSGQGFAKSLKMDCTTAEASPSASDTLAINQKFEGQNLQYLKKGTSSAESLTLSFWVKSSKTGTYIAELMDNDNSYRHINKSYTISAADTWEKKTITFAGDTTGAFGNDNGASLELRFWLGSGSNHTGGTLQTSWGSLTQANRAVGQVNLGDSTSNEWYVTGVQLEAGTAASDFEFLPVDVNLQRCQRYYEELVSNDGFDIYWSGYTSSNYDDASPYSFKVEKRAVPSGSFSGSWTFSNVSGSTFDLTQRTKNLITFVWLTSGAGRYYVNNGGSGDKIKFDAEL